MVEIIPFHAKHWIVPLALLITLVDVVLSQNNRVSLQTKQGVWVGTREPLIDRDGRSRREYYAFTGIQYGKSPTAERRWEESEMEEILEGTHYATSYGSECPQYDKVNKRVIGSENCLFLNIYTPYLPAASRGTTPSRPLLPVIVYIHGGKFESGSGNSVGPRRFMKQDVLLVTINYRLGVFGYLTTGDKAVGGNFGGLDQILALKWIQEFIRGFGGNPGRVTVMGHSAGAASVHMLLLAPRAMGLFHAAIIQSGSAFCDWAINEDPRGFATKMGEYFGCVTDESYELLNCLLEKSPEELVEAQEAIQTKYKHPFTATPVIDGWRGEEAFLADYPKNLMEAGAFAQVPVITGVVHDEGLGIYADVHLSIGEKFRDQQFFEEELLPDLLSAFMDKPEPLPNTVEAVKAQYFEEMDVVNETKRVITEVVQMIGDKNFYSCHFDMLETFATVSRSSVYSYVFSHKTANSPSLISNELRRIRQMGIHHPLFNYGISHGDELFYLFEPIKGFTDRMDMEDLRVADLITRAWVSFATTGSPASGLQLIPNSVPWRPIKPGNINYYNITSQPSPMGEDFRKGEALFWLRTVPYIQHLGTTISELEDYPMYFWIALGVALFLLLVTLILACVLWRTRVWHRQQLSNQMIISAKREDMIRKYFHNFADEDFDY